jgi:hypothetical protein
MENNDAAAVVPQHREAKLPTFWPLRPAAWFAIAESRFRLKGIEDQQTKFDHLLSSLPDDVVAGVLDVVEAAMRDDEPYDTLKERLLETHELSNFEKLDVLFKVERLGGRKPSQLLQEMLQVCPEGEETGLFFHYMFLQRLPPHLKAMLGEVEEGDPRALAARADKLLAMNPLQHNFVAAVADTEDSTVAAVSSQRGRGRGGRSSQRGGHSNPSRGGQAGSNTGSSSTATLTPTSLAQESSGLCHYHWTYGDKAKRCRSPCSWQGN